MSIELIPGRTGFNDSSPKLLPGAARERFRAWAHGEEILSGLVEVGYITPNENDHHFLLRLQTHKHDHNSDRYPDDLIFSHPDILEQRRAFQSIVMHDLGRVGIPPTGSTRIVAGRDTGVTWHADLANWVRYVVSFGDYGTIGASGIVSEKDNEPDRIRELLGNGTLKLQEFAPYTVLRFLRGDIHRGTNLNRVLMQHTVLSQDYVAAT